MKAASTVLTGGLGRRTERQRALILPTDIYAFLFTMFDMGSPAP